MANSNILKLTETLEVIVTSFSKTFTSYYTYTPKVCDVCIPYKEIYNRVELPEKFWWRMEYANDRDREFSENPILTVFWESYSERHWEDSPKQEDLESLYEILKEFDVV